MRALKKAEMTFDVRDDVHCGKRFLPDSTPVSRIMDELNELVMPTMEDVEEDADGQDAMEVIVERVEVLGSMVDSQLASIEVIEEGLDRTIHDLEEDLQWLTEQHGNLSNGDAEVARMRKRQMRAVDRLRRLNRRQKNTCTQLRASCAVWSELRNTRRWTTLADASPTSDDFDNGPSNEVEQMMAEVEHVHESSRLYCELAETAEKMAKLQRRVRELGATVST